MILPRDFPLHPVLKFMLQLIFMELPSSIVKKTPDRLSAIYALSTASMLIEDAKDKYDRGNFVGTITSSRDAMRMASSALLFNDGYIAPTFEATVFYLSKKYPKRFPLEEWKAAESPSISGRLSSLLGSALSMQEEASKALNSAEKFVAEARQLLRIRE